tara:strand:- start:349 stop:1482 length:1134 start_codon:yes stop_codon:yes gene_type:complete
VSSVKVICGDALESLRTLEDQSVNTCVTSPPFWGLRDYGKDGQLGLEDTPQQYVDNLVKVFREVRRVLRDDGTAWLNLGDSYSSGGRTTTTNQTLRGDKDYGVTRPKPSKGIKPKDLIGIPWRVAFALQEDGWYLRQDIIWHKPNPMPESVQDRCTKAHEYIFLLSKNSSYYYDNDVIKDDAVGRDPGNVNKHKGSGERFGRTKFGIDAIGAVTHRNKRSVWTVPTKPNPDAHFATYPPELIRPCIMAGCPEKICVVCGEPYVRAMERPGPLKIDKGKRSGLPDRKIGRILDKYHRENPPIDLGVQKQCDCRTDETEAGIVLDPFAGSGTTGQVAAHNQRDALLIELNSEYVSIIEKRLGSDMFIDLDVEHLSPVGC